VAVGASGYATTYNGTSWSTATDADSTRTMDAVSCTSSTFCVAVDTSGYATTYNGTSWSTPTDIDSTRSVNAVSCTSSTFCVAVDTSGYATTYNGTSWSTPTDIDSTRTLDAVSCTSSTFCEAVDTSGYATKYTGTWATATDIDSTRSIDTVTCVSTTFCVAAGASGYATKYNGISWSTATDADSTRTIKTVVCPTSSLCVAVDTSGYATTYNGTSWATPTDIDGSAALEALSCVSSTSCDATDNAGNVLTYNGTSWSTPTDIDAARSVNAISCVSATFCIAADGSGYVAVYHPLSTTGTNQLIWDTNGSLSQVLADSTNDYIYGPNNEPVEQVNLSNSAPTYLTYTASDSSWLATNNAGQQVAFWRYDAFGNLATGTPDSPFGYAGQYTDASTGFSNLRARFYEPQTGGFTTRDPAFSSTDTAYTYAGDDPVNESDPSGDNPNCSILWVFDCHAPMAPTMYTQFSLLAGYGENQCSTGFACGYALTSVVDLWNSTPGNDEADATTTLHMLSLVENSYASGKAPSNNQFDQDCADSLAGCLGDLIPGYTPGMCGQDALGCFQLADDNTLVYWSQQLNLSDAAELAEVADDVDKAAELGGPLLDYAAAASLISDITTTPGSGCTSPPIGLFL